MKIKALQSSFFVAVVMLLAWLPASSFAAGVSAPSAFDAFMWTATGGQNQTVGFGTNGTPIATPAPPLIDTDSGLPRVTQSGTLTNPSGKPFTVSAAGRISAANTAKAVGKVILQNTWPIVVGAALYDLFKELGYDALRLPDGSLTVTKSSPIADGCGSPPPSVSWVFSPSPAGGCYGTYGGVVPVFDRVVGSGGSCIVYFHCSDGAHVGSQTSYAATGVNSPGVQSSVAEFTNAVAAKSGWPSTSAISRVLADPAASQGEKIAVEPVTVTGPSTSEGRQTVTKNTTNNTTKTETVSHQHTYQGANVQTTTVTSTTVVNNIDNSVVNQETKTESPEVPKTESCGLPGRPVCAVKVDESGTPTDVAENKYQPKADAVKASQEAGLDHMKTPGDTSGMFSGWNTFFGTPAMVTCTPIALPAYKGTSMGSLDPCPVVDGMREVMAYLWAAGGLFLCLGMIRQTVQGG